MIVCFASIARAHDRENELGIAVTTEPRLYDAAAHASASGAGFGVYQHTHFARLLGTRVGVLTAYGTDGRDRRRFDLSFLMPGILLRVPTKGDVQPYASTGFVMAMSWFSTGADYAVKPFMYAGNRSSLGVEWRTEEKQTWFVEVVSTIRGRFTVEESDKATMATHPDFARETRVVHEVSLAIGGAFFFE
jgi:hypothetical protein